MKSFLMRPEITHTHTFTQRPTVNWESYDSNTPPRKFFTKYINIFRTLGYLKFKMLNLAYISKEHTHGCGQCFKRLAQLYACVESLIFSDTHEIPAWVNSWGDMTRGSVRTVCCSFPVLCCNGTVWCGLRHEDNPISARNLPAIVSFIRKHWAPNITSHLLPPRKYSFSACVCVCVFMTICMYETVHIGKTLQILRFPHCRPQPCERKSMQPWLVVDNTSGSVSKVKGHSPFHAKISAHWTTNKKLFFIPCLGDTGARLPPQWTPLCHLKLHPCVKTCSCIITY